jgi:hypothetical protein
MAVFPKKKPVVSSYSLSGSLVNVHPTSSLFNFSSANSSRFVLTFCILGAVLDLIYASMGLRSGWEERPLLLLARCSGVDA